MTQVHSWARICVPANRWRAYEDPVNPTDDDANDQHLNGGYEHDGLGVLSRGLLSALLHMKSLA